MNNSTGNKQILKKFWLWYADVQSLINTELKNVIYSN